MPTEGDRWWGRVREGEEAKGGQRGGLSVVRGGSVVKGRAVAQQSLLWVICGS